MSVNSYPIGGQGGVLELNLMLPLIAHNLTHSIEILNNVCQVFTDKLLDGLEANEDVCNGYIEGSLAMCTSLVPVIGYDKAAQIAYKAFSQDKTIREVVLEEKILKKEDIEKLLNHKNTIKSKK